MLKKNVFDIKTSDEKKRKKKKKKKKNDVLVQNYLPSWYAWNTMDVQLSMVDKWCDLILKQVLNRDPACDIGS